eukprot:356894-Chlamydomonas_euryale.AAC.6
MPGQGLRNEEQAWGHHKPSLLACPSTLSPQALPTASRASVPSMNLDAIIIADSINIPVVGSRGT